MTKLQINTIDGEEIPTRRRRLANALIQLLEEDEILRQEVAIQLYLDPGQLSYRKALHPPKPSMEFIDLLD